MKTERRYRGIVTLAALLVAMPVLAWQLALKETCTLWRNYRTERILADSLAGSVVREADKETADGFAMDDREWIQSGLLLDTLLGIAGGQGVKVAGYTPYVTDSQAEMTVRTAEVLLSGRFASVLRTIDRIERDGGVCRLCSVSFGVVENRTARTRELRATILLQQITRNP